MAGISRRPCTCSGRVKQKIDLQNGISKENSKKITTLIKESKLKVSAQIQDEQVRVQGAKIDDLQSIITLIRQAEFDFPTQFVNMK